MTFLFIGIAAIVAALVARFLYGVLFDGAADFWDCVGFALRPDIFSLMRGQYMEDIAKSFKLSAFLIAVGGSGFLVYWGLSGLIG